MRFQLQAARPLLLLEATRFLIGAMGDFDNNAHRRRTAAASRPRVAHARASPLMLLAQVSMLIAGLAMLMKIFEILMAACSFLLCHAGRQPGRIEMRKTHFIDDFFHKERRGWHTTISFYDVHIRRYFDIFFLSYSLLLMPSAAIRLPYMTRTAATRPRLTCRANFARLIDFFKISPMTRLFTSFISDACLFPNELKQSSSHFAASIQPAYCHHTLFNIYMARSDAKNNGTISNTDFRAILSMARLLRELRMPL